LTTVKKEYLDRIVDKELDLALRSFGAVLIEGPKWCGKTMTAETRSASAIYLQDIRQREEYIATAKVAPDVLLEGKVPRLIDEWQTIPLLWDGVRFEVDRRGERGQFILTGSAVPADNATMHTGTGRIARLLMRPMSLFESRESNGDVSLRALFNNEDIKGNSKLTIEKLAFALMRGGWPASVGEDEAIALRHAREYVKAVVSSDVSRMDGAKKNPRRIRKVLLSLARNVSTMVKKKTIMDDVSAGDEETISDKTLSSYLNAFRRLFITEDLQAWSPSIRSRTILRTSPKCHFVDPSVAAVLLRLSPPGLMRDFNTFGLLFESLCIRDLRIYAQAMEGDLFHYHDGSGLEADAIIHLYDGRWGAIETKMGASDVEKAAENLKKLREKVDHEKMNPPSFLMVLTATEFAYRRTDGVYVVPIGCLRD
jgi:predicted AAA+ superfamily ATPase